MAIFIDYPFHFDGRGRTALLAATQRNHVEIARLLINEGADVNVKDFNQDSPFLYAGAEGRVEILRLMLPAGADLAQRLTGQLRIAAP